MKYLRNSFVSYCSYESKIFLSYPYVSTGPACLLQESRTLLSLQHQLSCAAQLPGGFVDG